mgnify:FL=1
MENELVSILSVQVSIIASVVSIIAVTICSVISAVITQRGAKSTKQTELIFHEMITAYYDLLRAGGEFSDVTSQEQVTRFTDAYTRALLFATPKTKELIQEYRDSITKISVLKLNPPEDFMEQVRQHEDLSTDLVNATQKDLRK